MLTKLVSSKGSFLGARPGFDWSRQLETFASYNKPVVLLWGNGWIEARKWGYGFASSLPALALRACFLPSTQDLTPDIVKACVVLVVRIVNLLSLRLYLSAVSCGSQRTGEPTITYLRLCRAKARQLLFSFSLAFGPATALKKQSSKLSLVRNLLGSGKGFTEWGTLPTSAVCF